MIAFTWFITYLAIGCFAAGMMLGNSSNPPEPWSAAVVVFAWPFVAILTLMAGVFGAGAWVAEKLGGGS